MGVFDSVKKAAAKTKLRADMVMLDREIETVKKKLGGELFTVLFNQEHGSGQNNDWFQQQHEKLVSIYMACKEDVMSFVTKKQSKGELMDVLEEKREAPATQISASQKAKNAMVSAKVQAEIAYYDREIKVRKEIFGIQVFEELGLMDEAMREPSDSSEFDMEGKNDEVLSVLEGCVADVRRILERKEAKSREIEALSS
jgi:hypothetical protein